MCTLREAATACAGEVAAAAIGEYCGQVQGML